MKKERLNLKELRKVNKGFMIVLFFMLSFNVFVAFSNRNFGVGLMALFFIVIQVVDYLQVLDDEKMTELDEKYLSSNKPTEKDISMMVENMRERYEESDANYRRLVAFIIFLKVLVVSIPIVIYFR